MIEFLEWDSAFFNLKIGVVKPGIFNAVDFNNEKQAYDLIYIFEYAESILNETIENIASKPVDTKITYTKHVTELNNIELSSNIRAFEIGEPSQDLLSLAIQSGIYSRFKTDTGFPEGSFERMYTEWIKKSTQHQIAFEVITFNVNGVDCGLLTLGKNKEKAVIGLLSVNHAYRGIGIGKKLIMAADFYAGKNNFTTLDVSTQSANKSACLFYESCGFVVNETINIYHYWNR